MWTCLVNTEIINKSKFSLVYICMYVSCYRFLSSMPVLHYLMLIIFKLGLERFHSVAILGFNSPEWFISAVGAVFAG